MSDGDEGAGPGYAYTRVRDEIRGGIVSGLYAPGALLPSVREIQAQWGVSTTTARRALHELVRDGYARAQGRRGHLSLGGPDQMGMITPPSGSGSQIRHALLVRAAQVISTDTAVITVDGHVSAVDVRQETPPPRVAQALGVTTTTPVLVRRRVFVDAGGAPVQLRTSYLPLALAAGTPLSATEVLDAPWPFALASCTHHDLAECATQITARHPTDVEAAALDLRADSAVLVRDDVTYDTENDPLDFTRTVWPGDTIRLTARYAFPHR